MPAKIQRGQEGITGTNMILITIDGKRHRARKDETVLEVCLRHGIRIPTLCYSKELSPYGGCRLCIVEVEGKRAPMTSCTLLAEPGMVVRTNTPRLQKLRRATLQLILSEHPSACLICRREEECDDFQECIKKSAVTFGCKSCAQNDDCEFQDLVRELSVKDVDLEFRYRGLEVERHDPFFDRDYNLCVLCGRCVRVCSEVRYAHTLEFIQRGPDTIVGTAFDLPHLESGCQFCGACVDVCPTGALRDRFSRYDGPPDRKVKTTCVLCNMGCAIDLGVSNGKITRSTPHKDQICSRGRFAIAPLANHPKRVTRPLLRKSGGLVEVEWDEALDFVARQLSEQRGRTGILFSGQMPVEAIDRLSTLAGLSNAHIAAPSAGNETAKPLRMDRFGSNPAIIVVNTDMVADFPILLLKLRKKFRGRAVFIVIDPVVRQSDNFADIVINPVPGSEHAVVKAICGKGRIPKDCAVDPRDIERAKTLIETRDLRIVYDASAFCAEGIVRPARTVLLNKETNALRLARPDIGRSIDPVLSDEKIDCLYLVGVAPRIERRYRTIIVQDCFLPDIDLDVFLPAATFAETGGSIVDIEGKTRKLRPAIDPKDRAMPDQAVVEAITARLAAAGVKKTKTRKRADVRRARPTKTTREFPLRLLVRNNAYIYRNRALSELLTGFERMRQDRCAWVNERTAGRAGLGDGAQANIVGRNISWAMDVKICPSVPDNAILVINHPQSIRMDGQPVRLECTGS